MPTVAYLRISTGGQSLEALVGFQGRGCVDGVQPNCCHPFLLETLLFQPPSIGSALLGPWWSIRPRNPIRASRECNFARSMGKVQPKHSSAVCQNGDAWRQVHVHDRLHPGAHPGRTTCPHTCTLTGRERYSCPEVCRTTPTSHSGRSSDAPASVRDDGALPELTRTGCL